MVLEQGDQCINTTPAEQEEAAGGQRRVDEEHNDRGRLVDPGAQHQAKRGSEEPRQRAAQQEATNAAPTGERLVGIGAQ